MVGAFQADPTVVAYANEFASIGFEAFCTGSFRSLISDEESMWRAAISFLRRVGQWIRRPIPATIVLESKDQGQRPNVHLLVRGVAEVPDYLLQRSWREGNFDIRRPINGGAYHYLAQKIVYAETPWRFWPDRFTHALNARTT